MMMKIVASSGMALCLSACGGSGGGTDDTQMMMVDPERPMFSDPIAPTLSAADYLDSRETFDALDAINRTSPVAPPAGVGLTATYNGVMDAQFPIGTDGAQRMVGDISLDVGVGTSRVLGNVTGSIDNLHIVKDNIPIESLTGEITMGGQYNFTGNNELNVNGSGDVSGNFGTQEAGEMRVNISLRGDMRGTLTDSLIGITGRVQGNAVGDFGFPLFYSETSTVVPAGQFHIIRDGATLPE